MSGRKNLGTTRQPMNRRLGQLLISALLSLSCTSGEIQETELQITPTLVRENISSEQFTATPVDSTKTKLIELSSIQIPSAKAVQTSDSTFIAIPTPTATLIKIGQRSAKTPPERNLYDLTNRLSSNKTKDKDSGKPNERPEIGSIKTFQVLDIVNLRALEVTAALNAVTDNAFWYVDTSIQSDDNALKLSAGTFEENIRPSIISVFGTEHRKGIDGDERLTVLHTPIFGLDGYFSSTNEYSQSISPYSNETGIIFIDTTAVPLNSAGYFGTLAHEFTHVIQFRADKTEEGWINEGLAEVGRNIAGYESIFEKQFLFNPSTSLINWSTTPASYGATNLFFQYISEQYGLSSLRSLMENKADGIHSVNELLYQVDKGADFKKIFANWTVANYLDRKGVQPYMYPDSQVQVAAISLITEDKTIASTVPQYGTRYYEFVSTVPIKVNFAGSQETPFIPPYPSKESESNHCWWGNRGDSIDSTLTTQVKLASEKSLSLQYSIWYEIEEGWDYAYVTVSNDEGVTWEILPGDLSSNDNPMATAFGPGYTGSSDEWVKDQVSLNQYLGEEVLIRFEYVTDDSVHGAGICIDDITISGIDFHDGAEGLNTIWDANGFVRTTHSLPQKYLVHTIDMTTSPEVKQINLNHENDADISIGSTANQFSRTVLIVSAVQNYTQTPASFVLSAEFG